MMTVQKLLNLLRRPPVKVRWINRETSSLTLDEWIANKDLVLSARRVLGMDEFKTMLDVLRNSHLSNYQMKFGTPIEDRATMQARGEGYSMCLADIMAMGQLKEPMEVMEPTFEEPEIQTTQIQ